ncbi:hypothetical protein [Baaleninema sp.]|uniref:hypothetical protein n=1 Tax=Baaleninema sp. TaxID=3101197 RepID=UPI003CFCA049
MENYNYPVPDPTWDYLTIYDRLYESKFEIERLIAYLSRFEDASPEADREAKEALDRIGQNLNQARRMFDINGGRPEP